MGTIVENSGSKSASPEIQQHYREVALGERKGQCAFDLKSSGYSERDLADVPAGVCSLSQGCGNVSALGELRPGSVVLDIGSGAGLDLFIASKKVGPTGRVIGVEPVKELRETSLNFIRESGNENITVVEGDAMSLPIESNSVDCVLSNCVFSLFNNPKAVSEVHRVLRPRARFAFSDIFVRERAMWVFSLVRTVLGPFVPALREYELSRQRRIDSLRAVGFETVDIASESTFSPEEIKNLLDESGVPSWLGPIARRVIYRSELAVAKGEV